MQVRKYVMQQGVYSGYTVLCLRCKGMTYLPPQVFQQERAFEHMREHDLWCPAVLEEALARLLK